MAAITSVDPKYIVPKQGNWWNPQVHATKPDTWCAYIIRSDRPRTVPFYNTSDNGTTNGVTVEKIATIDLQFVGPQSEEIAQNVAFWPLRADVATQFARVHGSIMNDTMDALSSPFYQDGNNTVVAWNVTIKVLHYSLIDTNQSRFPETLLGGKVNRL